MSCNQVLNNIDLIYYIIKFNNYKIKEFLSLKHVNQSFNDYIKKYIHKRMLDEDIVYTCRTFIPVNTCMVCNRNNNSMFHLVYLHDNYPRRVTVHCDIFSCFINSKKSYAYEALKQNIILLNEPLNIIDKLYIPRSNNGKTLAEIDKYYICLINNKIFFKFSFKVNNDIYNKCCYFNDLLDVNEGKYKKSLIELGKKIVESRFHIQSFYEEENIKIINNSIDNLIEDIKKNKKVIACNRDN